MEYPYPGLMVKDVKRRASVLPRLIQIEAAPIIAAGHGYADSPECHAIALWCRQDERDSYTVSKVAVALAVYCSPTEIRHLVGTLSTVENEEKKLDIPSDAEYLSVLGCEPDYQKRGLATHLVTAGLQQLAKEGRCAHLNTALRCNAEFYGQFGFEVIHTVEDKSQNLFTYYMLWRP